MNLRLRLGLPASEHALRQLGTREEPAGSNRGPQVDEYLRSVGIRPERGSFPWCAAFVHWCFERAAQDLATENPCPRTAGALALWRLSPRECQRLVRRPSPGKVSPMPMISTGDVFVINHGGGKGHVGFVLAPHDELGRFPTVEGNTNLAGSREGDGVFRRVRKLSECMGFLTL